MIDQFDETSLPVYGDYVKYWELGVLFRRSLENTTDGRQKWLPLKGIRDAVIEKRFPRRELPRAPIGSLAALQSLFRGHILMTVNQLIKERKVAEESIREQL